MAERWTWTNPSSALDYPAFARALSQSLGKLQQALRSVTVGAYPNTRTVTTDATLDSSDYTLRVDASGGARTVALPPSADQLGRVYVVKKIDSSGNAVTIDGSGSETIDGSATLAITTQYGAKMLQCNGTGWDVLSSS